MAKALELQFVTRFGKTAEYQLMHPLSLLILTK